jgi:hypothetical protein
MSMSLNLTLIMSVRLSRTHSDSESDSIIKFINDQSLSHQFNFTQNKFKFQFFQ